MCNFASWTCFIWPYGVVVRFFSIFMVIKVLFDKKPDFGFSFRRFSEKLDFRCSPHKIVSLWVKNPIECNCWPEGWSDFGDYFLRSKNCIYTEKHEFLRGKLTFWVIFTIFSVVNISLMAIVKIVCFSRTTWSKSMTDTSNWSKLAQNVENTIRMF